jgi:antitoxin component YwqK of YwqJK toxin-antitoxin module
MNKIIKIIVPIFLLIFMVWYCFAGRTKVSGEVFFSEVVYEEKGIYYRLSAPNTKRTYTGTSKCYYHSNGNIKGVMSIKNGLPDGKWIYYNRDGTLKYTLTFEAGHLIERNNHINWKQEITMSE